MFIPTPTQQRILDYVREGRFFGRKQAALDLQLNVQTIWSNLRLLEAHGLISKRPTYEVTNANSTNV